MKMEFNSDGSIKVPEKAKKRLEPEEKVLKLIEELSYPLGKRLLAEVLKGEYTARVKKLKLNFLSSYGTLELYDYPDIYRLLDKMLFCGMIKVEKSHKTGFLPVVVKADGYSKDDCQEELNKEDFDSVTEEDREKFEAFGEFLHGFNDEQKKSIIDNSKRLLCVAGAGSGKTTVLTKRIEFLAKFRSVPTEKILSITFTRKARQEMMSRLANLIPGHKVNIETFNSFCEKLLQKNGELIYDKTCRVMNFSDKIQLFQNALSEVGVSVSEAIDRYYTRKKIRETDRKKLFIDLINDVFSILESCTNNELSISETRAAINSLEKNSEKNTALFVYSVLQKLEKLKHYHGLRDYSDQLRDGLKLIKAHPELVDFEHVLVDEFQDVNKLQINIIDAINPDNLFAVGDPRQSIYGWRGSRVEYIMNFKKLYPESKIIQLSKNYRSCSQIVNTGNILIKGMNLPPLESAKGKASDITLINHTDEESEAIFIAQSILSLNIPRNQIFILVRTNRQADFLSDILNQHQIDVLKRTVEEQKQKLEPAENEVTISTVHAIKGLEAQVVYVAGANSNSFPCLISEKPVLDKMKLNNHYDKYMEELRLLYVAMTRARERLIISYSSNLSPFITQEVLDNVKSLENGTRKVSAEDRLRNWRLEKSRELGMKPYMVFSDKALFQLLAMKPRSYDELASVRGIGETKVNSFGDELLDVINTL